MAKKPGRLRIPRSNLLQEDERRALTDEARKSVLADLKQEERDAWFEQERTRLLRETVPTEQMVHVTIDLAPYCAFLMLDGVQFFHGYTYEVGQPQCACILEQMYRSWTHQDEIDGRGRS